MAATITTVDSFGKVPTTPSFTTHLTLVPDTSYPAGGYTLGVATKVPSGATVADVHCKYVVTSTGAPVLAARAEYNAVTDKVMIITIGTTPAEASGDLSANTVHITVFSY